MFILTTTQILNPTDVSRARTIIKSGLQFKDGSSAVNHALDILELKDKNVNQTIARYSLAHKSHYSIYAPDEYFIVTIHYILK